MQELTNTERLSHGEGINTNSGGRVQLVSIQRTSEHKMNLQPHLETIRKCQPLNLKQTRTVRNTWKIPVNCITFPLPDTLLRNKDGIRTSLHSCHQNWAPWFRFPPHLEILKRNYPLHKILCNCFTIVIQWIISSFSKKRRGSIIYFGDNCYFW